MLRSNVAVLAAALSPWAVSCDFATPQPSHTTRAAASQQAVATKPTPPAVVRSNAARHGSGILLAQVLGPRPATLAYVADEDDHAIRVIDVDTPTEVSMLPLPGTPAQLVMLPTGRLVVALRDRHTVALLDGVGTADAPLSVREEAATPSEPIGLALSPDDATLLVTSGWGQSLTAYALAYSGESTHLEARRTWSIGREPRAVVVSDDGKRAFVSHAVGSNIDVIDLASDGSQVAAIPVDGIVGGRDVSPSSASLKACQGFALAKSFVPAGRILAPHVIVASGVPEFPSEGYGESMGIEAESFDVAVLDEDRAAAMKGSLLLADVARRERACTLPRAAVAGRKGALYVTCLGENSVLELDGAALNPHDLEIKRWKVPAGPTAIALHEASERAFVWSQFGHALSTLALDARAAVVSASLTLPRTMRRDPHVERGRLLFHAVDDARISSDGRACASCHPDGRDDGLLWSSPEGPRQTPMLAGRIVGTAPYGWNGTGNDVAAHLEKTFRRLGGKGLVDRDRDALVAFITAMPPPAEKPASSDVANLARGEAIFRSAEAGCAICHGTDGRSPDGERHDVKSHTRGDALRTFDTPSLRFVGGTAPYFHDGRYATLHELLVASNGKMGNTEHLHADELAALEAYVRSR
ncbi:hypothetical protein LVJ94_04150 [Pendulispora rubella]|uniref:Cytochrome c domain-containing protein n=1 Tax=Pendulispora rubella TaxID=2741070 RepID=A0ABZ2L9F2_9BACT